MSVNLRCKEVELCRGFLTCMDGNVYKIGCKNMIPKKGLVKDGEFDEE